MLRTLFCAALVMLGSSLAHGQDPYIPYVEWSEPNPPRPASGPNPAAEGGSTAPDGYSPIPQWAGQTRAPIATEQQAYELETVVSGIAQGFAFRFLPDGNILLSERPGNMRIAYKDGRLGEPLTGLPPMWTSGPQGLLDVRLDRNFAANRIIYFSYTAPPAGPVPDPPPRLAGIQHVARARLSSDLRRLEDVEILINTEGIEGRLIQAPDGTLVITSGVPAGVGILSSQWPHPQQLDSRMGKALRINTDGSVPKDNPFVGRRDAHPEIYALGLREDQGLAIHPETGKVWASSNGPKGGDEINVIESGKNYGFPIIGYGREYSGQPINGDLTAREGTAGVFLDALDRALRNRVLHGRLVPRLERGPLRGSNGADSQACGPPCFGWGKSDRRRATTDGNGRAVSRRADRSGRRIVCNDETLD